MGYVCRTGEHISPRALVSVHGHPLRAAAQFTVSRRANGPAVLAASTSAALLQGEQLLGTECLVVDLGRGLDQVLQVGTQQKVTQVHKLAVLLILDVDDTPPVLAGRDLLASNDDGLLGTDNSKGDAVLAS